MSEFDIEFARAFHGHLGPFLALGMLIGAHAMKLLNARKYFGVKVIVHCPPKPPASCMLDGIQLSTGATYGKRNIELIPSDEIKVEVSNTDTGQCVHVLVRSQAVERMLSWLKELGEEGAAMRVLSCGLELLEVINR
ncbi:MAG: hypothetical protein HZRFUVUK_001850 [Candidatus Fervidibacterota bacterium]|jgi:formylmethanofuran dehydrogenase subunit E